MKSTEFQAMRTFFCQEIMARFTRRLTCRVLPNYIIVPGVREGLLKLIIACLIFKDIQLNSTFCLKIIVSVVTLLGIRFDKEILLIDDYVRGFMGLWMDYWEIDWISSNRRIIG